MLNHLRKAISPDNPIRLLWHRFKGVSAAIKHGFPGKKMVIIGVTGTNGKTTTTHMIEHLLRSAGKKVAMMSTIEFRIKGKITPNRSKKTTLSPFKTQKFLKRCLTQGVDYVVLESSSHALHQSRLYGIQFTISVLTNITHEHLDYHGTMEKYKEAKKILFKNSEKTCDMTCPYNSTVPHQHAIVINTTDEFYEEFATIKCPTKIKYGFDDGNLQAQNATYTKYGTKFALNYQDETAGINLKLPGSYNVENALAASGAAFACKCTLDQIRLGLESFEPVPGRMETIKSSKGFEVIVDFALTPDALEKLYSEIKQTATGRIIGVFGATGDRDKEKRPEMGKIVSKYADIVIVTDDEPYTENPEEIRKAILEGVPRDNKRLNKNLFDIGDRYEAIEHAIKTAETGDVIVATGMGNFTTRSVNEGTIQWDEREIVREIINKNS